MVTERLFVILKPKLLMLPWFAKSWRWFIALRRRGLRWLRSLWTPGGQISYLAADASGAPRTGRAAHLATKIELLDPPSLRARAAAPDFRAIVSTKSTSDDAQLLVGDFGESFRDPERLRVERDRFRGERRSARQTDAPAKNSEMGTSSAVATKCSRLAPTRFLPFSYF